MLSDKKVAAEEETGTAKVQLKDLSQERDQLRGKVQELNNKMDQLSQTIQESKTKERLLEQRAKQLEVRGRCIWFTHIFCSNLTNGFLHKET